MGISTTVGRASDARIRSFSDDPAAADEIFIGCATGDSSEFCHLHDYWAGLHYLLTGEAQGGELPLAAIRRGDLTYMGVEDPIHAIHTTTTKAFAEALAGLSEEALRARFDPERMMHAAPGGKPIYPGRPWAFPGLADDTFRTLLSYKRGLHEFAAEAVKNGEGLLFCRHEDL